MIIQLGLLVIGFVLLIKGADVFVDGAAGLARKFGIPELVIGLTIVAMGTSAPEAAVSISAAFKGSADITIGNIVGSNILNILIILGLSCVVAPLVVAASTAYIEIPFMIAVTVLLFLLGKDGEVGFFDGVCLWGAFLAYLAYLFVMAKRDKAGKPESGEEKPTEKEEPLWKLLLFVVCGAGVIVLGSNIAVDAATAIARMLSLSERFIGLTIVALGTSLPELATSVMASKKGNTDIAIGNIVGSNVFNILFVVGTSALIIPVKYAAQFARDSYVAIYAAVLLFVCCVGKKRLGRLAGVVMLVSYGLYFVSLL